MHAPFNLAFNTETPYFEWLERPGNEARLKRFGPAMTGTNSWEVPGAIVAGRSLLDSLSEDILNDSVGFPWQDLSDRAVIVDVGGGIGSTAMLLAHTFPHLRFVVQDRPQVAEQGVKASSLARLITVLEILMSMSVTQAWRERCPDMLDSGRATFIGHDFFRPQPPLLFPGSPQPAVPSVYILRVVTHDWPDEFVTK